MKNLLHWFPFFPNDWLSGSVSELPPEDEGNYIRLLAYCWNTRGLPDDVDAISRMAKRSASRSAEQIAQRLTERYFTLNIDGRLWNTRLFEVYEIQLKEYSGCRKGSDKTNERLAERSASRLAARSTIRQSESETDLDSESKPNTKEAKNIAPPGKKQPVVADADKLHYSLEDHEWKNVTEEYLTSLRKAFPACTTELHLAQMAVWLEANPHKVKSNWKSFITRWLKKEQDKGGDIRSNQRKEPEAVDEDDGLQELKPYDR